MALNKLVIGGKTVAKIKDATANKDIVKIVDSNSKIVYVYQPTVIRSYAYSSGTASYVDSLLYARYVNGDVSEYRVKISYVWNATPSASAQYIFGSAGGSGWSALYISKTDPYLTLKWGTTEIKCHNSNLAPTSGGTHTIEIRSYGPYYSVTSDRNKVELFVDGTSMGKEAYNYVDLSSRPFALNGIKEWGATPVAADRYGVKNIVISKQVAAGEPFQELGNFTPVTITSTIPASLSSTNVALNSNLICFYDSATGKYFPPSAGTLDGAY